MQARKNATFYSSIFKFSPEMSEQLSHTCLDDIQVSANFPEVLSLPGGLRLWAGEDKPCVCWALSQFHCVLMDCSLFIGGEGGAG